MRYEHAVSRWMDSTSSSAVVNVGHMVKRIGILVFERFPLSDVCLLADAFRLANEAQADQSGPEGASIEPSYSIVMLSEMGGSVVSSCSLRVWTESLNGPLLNGFDTLFIVGGPGASRAKANERLIRRLRAIAPKIRVVKALDEGLGVLAAADLAFERRGWRSMSGPTDDSGQPAAPVVNDTQWHIEPGASIDVDAPVRSIAAALTVIKRDHGTPIARLVSERALSGTSRRLDAILDDDEKKGITRKITTAAHWIRENYTRHISVAEAAEVAKMSERNFLRRFKAQVGLTPSEYLLRARLDASCLLLTETDMSIDGIARRCGVRSGDGLAKIFRKRLSISPTDYRAAHRHSVSKS
ncbi:GlxA family transcriptional regulator [Paraburkholderia caribensis]|uniref:GlxA family transcriptional regulator n=2 Tax=Paraburkholderia caribensis TaxID=75105 RepID=UPI0006D45C5B|nr:AraC family transcriptional regulator [Paraburkholderia caribensis]AMV43597.1 AraC family transcriptional regulator [Paraburkholderia caribensis]AUT52684.1 AraC family transcriptional regulator [Paraburkholderia caribensis]CAG9206498.1 AraC family transcriptional regulator [Paraburkholderia caribensis]